ncbi:MAG: acetylglutamate kinase [Proteobacteria bacterium]|nr:acetylglutamate kinase [Pseudomonadota bacterium]
MEDLIDKAKVLVEALPYIRRFYDKTIVVKYGGAAMANEQLKSSFALDMVLLKYIGINPVVVHGGGPQIGKVLAQMGIESRFVKGMRVTDDETMDVVEMVLVGKVNKEIVSLINRHGGKAVGLSGKDGQLITARKLNLTDPDNENPPEIVDLGMVGEVESINPGVIRTLESQNFIPVIAPVGVGTKGESYNINADTVAGQIASALKAEKLILLTDVKGLMNSQKELIGSIDVMTARKKTEAGVISGGMIPKVQCCIDALSDGVEKTHIIDGRVEHAILLEIFTDGGIGTQILLSDAS